MPERILTTAEFAGQFPREGTTVEFKRGTGADPLRKSMVAMWNADGGSILVGVEDDGHIVGVPDPGDVIDKVHDATRDVRDIGRYDVRVLSVGGKSVVELRLHRRVEGFSQLSDGRILVRRGEHDNPVYGGELTAFVMSRQRQRFESQPTGARLGDVDATVLDELVEVHNWDPRRENVVARLRERGLVDPTEDRLTVAGALFLTTAYDLGKAYVDLRRYPDDGDVYDKRQRFEGPLPTQVRAATAAVVDELGNDFVVSGAQRHEVPKLPPEVVREAIANAVAHRSYEASGMSTVIEVRPSRVVVRSPGGLPEGVTIENIRDAQSARNNVVVDVLRRFGVAEDAGRGVDVMQDRMADAFLDPPTFADLGGAFEVTLPVHSAMSREERSWLRELERVVGVAGRERLLLVHAARGDRLTNAIARSILEVDSTEARVVLRRLCDVGVLLQHGARGGATYSLRPGIGPQYGVTWISPTEWDETVMSYAHRPLTNAFVRELTGLSEPQTRALLQRLVASGRLVREGERRWTRYVLP